MDRTTGHRTLLTRRSLLALGASTILPLLGLAAVARVHARTNAPTAQAPAVQQNDGQAPATTRGEPPGLTVQDDPAAAAIKAAQDAHAAAVAPPQLPLGAMVFMSLPDPDVPSSIRALPTTLPNLLREPGQPWRLRGRLVEVVNHGVLVDRNAANGKLEGVPMGDAETSSPDGFEFQPRNGGELLAENAEQHGSENSRVREAGRFGEVNAYFYADRTLAFANALLAKLGEPALPSLRVVVNAHAGSRLPGYRQQDGETNDGKLRPFPGGHYRLPSALKTDGRFLHPVEGMNPTGEVHLGPGRAYITDSKDRDIIVDGRKYVRNASHVPGIIVHEVGHHIITHVADFTANRSRKPLEPDNEKIHMDEGTADYLTAVILETPDIYHWQHAAEGRNDRDNRDLRGRRTTDDFDRDGDPHRNGNIWASVLWDTRSLVGAQETDLLVMKMLALFGKVGPAGTTQAAIEEQMQQKDELRDGLAMLLEADEQLNQGKNRARILKAFDKRGIDLKTPDRKYNRD